MSQYVFFDGEPGPQIASNGGWGDFGRWVDGLDSKEYREVVHLREYGWSQEPGLLKAQLSRACQDVPPADPPTKNVATGLLGALRTAPDAVVISVSDGLTR